MTAEAPERVTRIDVIRVREAQKVARRDRDVEIWESIVAQHLRDQADRIDAGISESVTRADYRAYVRREWAADPDPRSRGRLAHLLGYDSQEQLFTVIRRWQAAGRRAA